MAEQTARGALWSGSVVSRRYPASLLVHGNKDRKASRRHGAKGRELPQSVIDHLFKPYWRAASRSGSEGLVLGLYLAGQIARAHGATMRRCSACCAFGGMPATTSTVRRVRGRTANLFPVRVSNWRSNQELPSSPAPRGSVMPRQTGPDMCWIDPVTRPPAPAVDKLPPPSWRKDNLSIQ